MNLSQKNEFISYIQLQDCLSICDLFATTRHERVKRLLLIFCTYFLQKNFFVALEYFVGF